MWWIAITGYKEGKPERLVAAYDPDSDILIYLLLEKACGLDYPEYPFIYFPILSPNYYNYTTCVKECPSFDGLNFSTIQCKTNHLI
jgi:hypothetical protein